MVYPTSEEINAFPEPLRSYVCDLETRCDPAGEVRERQFFKDATEGLLRVVEEMQGNLNRHGPRRERLSEIFS